ncbi:MAG: sigma-70 family RNA polymerase sigma factor [Actinomycetota bacterium]
MARSKVAQVFADEWPQLVATLRRDLGDLGLAEEAAAEAFTEAAARWGPTTTPDRPGAWLLTTARRKAIDTIRRDQRFADRLPALAEQAERPGRPSSQLIDDQLALIFGCCHASLNTEAQVALTLRQVCGLSTTQIADSFLVPTATMAKRLVRAKDKIRKAGIPFEVPDADELPERLSTVLSIIYLIFTAGHTSAEEGPGLVRGDLCDEARWLAEVLTRLLRERSSGAPPVLDVTIGKMGQEWLRDGDLPLADGSGDDDGAADDGAAEVLGLSALMAFADARRATRVDADGDLVLLEHQDRSRWDRDLIAEGHRLMDEAMAYRSLGPYQLQAAIAGIHATAPTWEETNWRSIVWLYNRLVRIQPTPVVALNRAVAIAMSVGPEAGLAAMDLLTEDGGLDGYRYLHAARADLLRRLARNEEAAAEYRRALDLGGNDAELAFLRRRLADLDAD